MTNPLQQSQSLPDHMEPAGDVVAASITIRTIPNVGVRVEGTIDDLQWTREALLAAKRTLRDHHARKKYAVKSPQCLYLKITVHASGALAVSGDISDLTLALVALDNALEGIKSERGRRLGSALLPAKDAQI